MQRGGPEFSFAGFLILAAFGAFLFKSAPLDSSRPTSTTDGLYENEQRLIPAKLWQDPFRTILLHPGARKLWTEVNAASSYQAKVLQAKHGCHNILGGLSSGPSGNQLRILAPMVTTGSRVEIEERRRRRRYAVVSALGEAGYVPNTPNAIGLCVLSKLDSGKSDNSLLIVPYEYYRLTSDSKPTQLLLLWLDESNFIKRPLGKLTSTFFHLLFPDNKTTRRWRGLEITVLGPARSDTLRRLAQRALDSEPEEKLTQQGVSLHVLSAYATVSPRLLFPEDGSKSTNDTRNSYEKLKERYSVDKCFENGVKVSCTTFARTIRNDDELATALANELRLRQIDPNRDHIALISEWDTLFGRSLPTAVEDGFLDTEKSRLCKTKVTEQKQHPANTCNILKFSYLRGIDGRLPGTVEGAGPEEFVSDDDSRNRSSSSGRAQDRRPAGPAQYDYLRRLAAELLQRDARFRADGTGGIKAIGILGSDVYDKLLLLRALRPQFPGIVFFTTDLDTQLLHRTDFSWTRNLIIASSFDLKLNPQLQGRVPPFRDSYQTSVFYATLLSAAFDHPYYRPKYQAADKAGLLKPLTPDCYSPDKILRFEVGRHGAVALRPSNQERPKLNCPGLAVQPEIRSRSPWPTLYAVSFIAIVLLVVIGQLKPKAAVPVIGLSGLLVFGLILFALAYYLRDGGEPVSFFDGISIWPTEFIRFAGACLAVYFVLQTLRGLQANCNRLSREHFFSTEWQSNLSHDTHPSKGFWSIKEWGEAQSPAWKIFCFIFVLLGVAGMVLPAILAKRDASSVSFQELVGILIVVWTSILFLWFFIAHKLLEVPSVNDWVESWKRSKLSSAKDFWKEYCGLGNSRARILRTISMWLLYMAIGSMVFLLLPPPPTPARGGAFAIDLVILIISVFTMLFLIFLVLDAYRLCVYWIRGLHILKLDWNGNLGTGEDIEDYPRRFARAQWKKVNLIAKRTSELSQLIYYPFVIIILVLLSRSSYFDNWGLPQAIAIIVCINVVLLVTAGIKFRREAECVRKECVQKLQQHLLERTSDDKDYVNDVITRIKEIRIGAFQPIFEQPLLRASLILLGAIGLSITEYARFFS